MGGGGGGGGLVSFTGVWQFNVRIMMYHLYTSTQKAFIMIHVMLSSNHDIELEGFSPKKITQSSNQNNPPEF